jgi:hypothetical protein
MRHHYRLAGYLLAALLLIGWMATGPQAWATPGQTSSQQTIPTRTPTPGPTEPPSTATLPPPTVPLPSTGLPPPTAPPPPTARRQPTVSAATATPTATPPIGGTPAPLLTPAASDASLGLSVQARPHLAWAGLPVEYTVTLVNQSANPLRDISLIVRLPYNLEPGAIISGAEADWEDQTLRIEKDELQPGEQLEVVFQAFVAAGLPAGITITSQVGASASGGLQAEASADIVLPPAELPRVGCGGDADR